MMKPFWSALPMRYATTSQTRDGCITMGSTAIVVPPSPSRTTRRAPQRSTDRPIGTAASNGTIAAAATSTPIPPGRTPKRSRRSGRSNVSIDQPTIAIALAALIRLRSRRTFTRRTAARRVGAVRRAS